MPRLKKRIVKEPHVPFMIKLEAAIVKEGKFPDIKSFVHHYIYKGNPILGLGKIIEEKYGIKLYYKSVAKRLGKFAPQNYNKHTRHHFKRRAIAGKSGGERVASISYFVNERIKKGHSLTRIAKALKMRQNHFRFYLEKQYKNIDFDGNRTFPDMVRFGMKKRCHYYKWLVCARKIGFESVTDAIEYLFVEMKLPINEIAFIFNVRPVVLMLRIKKCEYLNEKITKLLKRSKPMAISQIVEPMYEITGYQKSNLQFILNKLSDCIKIALEKNNSVQINGLGTFSIKVRKARIGRNPATGESIQIPEKKIVHFKMHKSLKDVFDKD